MLMEYRLFSMLLTSFGVFLGMAALEVAAATQSEFSFAAGTDSSGWAQARSNSEGRVMIESPEYHRGLWLNLVDKSGQALAGLEVEYQGRPDSLVALRCVDPAGLHRETLLWTRPAGDPIHLALKPSEADDLPAGLTFVDWHIDPSAESLLEPVAEARLKGWEGLADYLLERSQVQPVRVVVKIDTLTALAVSPVHPQSMETVVDYLKEKARNSLGGINTSTLQAPLDTRVFKSDLALIEELIIVSPSLIVLFEDSELEEQVKERLSLGVGPITLQEAAFTTKLILSYRSIQSLAGIECFTALRKLSLYGNHWIADVTPLAGLANLEWLSLSFNRIADVTPLASLTNLKLLYLRRNQIADISSLANLTNLEGMYLDDNQIADISSLANLTNLERLDLNQNLIIDVNPLVANPGLGKGDVVYLEGNPLSHHALNEQIPALKARGVRVRH